MPKVHWVCGHSQKGVQILLQYGKGGKRMRLEQRDHIEDWIKAVRMYRKDRPNMLHIKNIESKYNNEVESVRPEN